MTARTLTILVALLIGAAAPATLVNAQGQFADVEIGTTDLGNGLYMLTGAGGNIGVSVGDDGVILIDDQFAPLTDKILAALAKLSDQPVAYVINTHWHGDHTGGNENHGKAGSVIVAHDNVRVRMSTLQIRPRRGVNVDPSPDAALPVITFSETATLHFNGQTARAIHAPNGHTDGDAIIHFREGNVIHGGDLFFNGFPPFIDYDSGGTLSGLIAGLQVILALTDDDTKIIPGHGPLADRADLEETIENLQIAQTRLVALVADGQSADDIVAADPLADIYGDRDDEGAWRRTFTGLVTKSLVEGLE